MFHYFPQPTINCENDCQIFVHVVVLSGVEWSGVEWSGVEWSGVEWSGVE